MEMSSYQETTDLESYTKGHSHAVLVLVAETEKYLLFLDWPQNVAPAQRPAILHKSYFSLVIAT